jgi:dimethylhistidine N-methyltransferase
MLSKHISFHDYQPEIDNFRQLVLEGLSCQPKQIPPKFFYDKTGSELFEAILEQPEYYIPCIERKLLQQYADEFAELIQPDAVLIEPGSGSCEKIRLLLASVAPAAYVAMDISGDFLQQSVHVLGRHFPWLRIYATCLDFTHQLILPHGVPRGRRVVFIPGSSIGNFYPLEAHYFLCKVQRLVGKGGGLLIGVDRKKDPAILNAAYNDAAGITARFNLNLLNRINNELGGNFECDKFNHYAYYNDSLGRIEMHLISLEDQCIHIAGKAFQFSEGERLHTENSYKYSPDEFICLANASGFQHKNMWSDASGWFSLYFLEAC